MEDYKRMKKDEKLNYIIEQLDELRKNGGCSDDVRSQIRKEASEAWNWYRQLNPSGAICRECLSGAVCLADRTDTFALLPKNGIVAEVGVAFGDFSQQILDNMNPSIFYGIDWFNPDNEFVEFWGDTRLSDNKISHLEYYKKRFEHYIDDGQMMVRAGMSWDVLNEFKDDYFDFIYLDAAHDYESVKKDISVIEKKVKNGGYVQFNDYISYSPPEQMYYGVVPAVNEWLNSSKKHKVIARCFQETGFDDLLVKIFK